MFYLKDHFDNVLRFGDIIKGFQCFMPNFEELPDVMDSKVKIEIKKYGHFVVLTPCCSINNGSLSLVALKEINYKFFDNPHFAEDLTIINRKMPPDKAVSPNIWNDIFTQDERNKRIDEGPKYSFGEIFIYSNDNLLPIYKLAYKGRPGIETGYYMIDFKDIFTIKSLRIIDKMEYPKILQLSNETRNDLRLKISQYFSRVPAEEQLLEL